MKKIVRFEKRGDIFLPISPNEIRETKGEAKYIGTYLTFSEISEHKPTIKDLFDLSKDINQKDIIIFLSLLNTIVINDGHFHPDLQKRMINMCFSHEIIKRVFPIIKEEPRIVFSELQLTNLIKFFLMKGNKEGRKGIAELQKTDTLSNIFLIMNDLISEVGCEKSEEEKDKKQVIDEMLKIMIKQFPDLDVGNQKVSFILPRYYILFFEIPNYPDIKDHNQFFDIAKTFKEATDLELEEFYSLGFGMMAPFFGQSLLRNSINSDKIIINRETYFQQTVIDDKRRKKIYENLIATIDDFKALFEPSLSEANDFYFNNLTLMSKPLIDLDGTNLICLNLKFLISKITSGIFWVIFDWLKENDKDYLSFSNFHGIIFEKYVRLLFERIRGRAKFDSEINTIHFPTKYIGRKKTQEESTDIIIEYPRYLVFIEVVATRLRMKETLILGDVSKFWEDIEKIVFQKAKELQRKIDDFKNGLFTVGGRKHDKAEIYEIYPVIVTLEGIPYWYPIRQKIDEVLQERNLLQRKDGIGTLEILDIEELEYLELILVHENFLNLLKEKLNNDKYRNSSFKNFLHSTNRLQMKNEFLDEKFKYIEKRIEQILFNR